MPSRADTPSEPHWDRNDPAAQAIACKARDKMPRDFEARVQSLFGMTANEAALAARIAEGLPLKQGARLQGIRFSTTRSYLESAFHKTGAHQQSELVAILKTVQAR